MRVREAMTPWPYTVTSDQTLAEAIRVMADKGIHQLPVLEDYEIVGILTDGDVRIAVGPETRDTPIENLDLAPDAVDTVGDWMTPLVQTIGPDAFLSEAASIMAEHRIGALPVVGKEGDVIGIISVTDVLGRAVAALEEYEGSWDQDDD